MSEAIPIRNHAIEKQAQEIAKRMHKARIAWMEGEMKKRLPPILFKCAKQKRHLNFVRRWIAKQGYCWTEAPGVIALMRNGKMVSAFALKV